MRLPALNVPAVVTPTGSTIQNAPALRTPTQVVLSTPKVILSTGRTISSKVLPKSGSLLKGLFKTALKRAPILYGLYEVGDYITNHASDASEAINKAKTLKVYLAQKEAQDLFDKWYNDVEKVQNAKDSIQRVLNRIKNSRIFGKHDKKNNTVVSSGNSASSPSNSSSSWNSRYNDVLNNLTQEQQYYLDSKDINFQTASGLQEGLNKNFNSGLVVDDKWGSKSQAALDKILAEMSNEDKEKYQPPMTGTINQNDLYVPNNLQLVLTSPFAGINNPNPVLLNRTDIRSILSHYGYNPYSFTGGLRKALRLYLGGDRNLDISFIDKNSQMYKDWIAPFVTFLKKGGLLISNNPVERFKIKKGLNGFQITYKPLVAANSFFDDSKKKLKSEIESKMSEAQARNDRLESSHRKANKNNLAPRKANNTAYLLDLLYNIGAFGNIKYEKAVDGIVGKMTNNAIAKAQQMGYTIDSNGTLVKKDSDIQKNNIQNNIQPTKNTRFITSGGAYLPSHIIETATESTGNNPKVLNVADFLAHNPASIFLEDVDRANSNNITEKLFGIRPFKGRTITSLPTLLHQELLKQVLFAKSKGKNYFNNDLFKELYGFNYASSHGENNQDRSGFWNRINTPRSRLEHTLGAYTFYTDKNGDVIVEDTYDFNVGLKLGGDNKYAAMRNWAGEFASKSTDPNNGKIKYRINLGKI